MGNSPPAMLEIHNLISLGSKSFFFRVNWRNFQGYLAPFVSGKFVVNFGLVGSVVFCIHFSYVFNINKGPFPLV